MREYLASKKGKSASISEIEAVIEPKAGIAPASSHHSPPQHKRHFERVPPRRFRLRAGA